MSQLNLSNYYSSTPTTQPTPAYGIAEKTNFDGGSNNQQISTTNNSHVVGIVVEDAYVIEQTPNVNSHLCCSVVSVFFCIAFGVVAILTSLESRTAQQQGNIVKAKEKASSAKKFAIAAIIIGVLALIALIVILIIQFKD